MSCTTSPRRWPVVVCLLVLLGTWLAAVCPADAHLAGGRFRLTSQQEIPPPIDAEIASGTATLQLIQVATPGGGLGFTLQYDITVVNLTGAPTAAHIHAGVAGSAGPPVHTLAFTSATPGAGSLVGEVTGLTFADVEELLGGRRYLNVHTVQNPDGEVRGQIQLVGVCQCGGVTRSDRAAFKRCVKDQTRENNFDRRNAKQYLPSKQARAELQQLVKRVALIARKAVCGPPKPTLTATCCMPADALGMVAGPNCAAVKRESQCVRLGGTFLADTSCTVTSNPCVAAP
jgi:hypothetical protein